MTAARAVPSHRPEASTAQACGASAPPHQGRESLPPPVRGPARRCRGEARHRDSERGSAAAEITILTPLLVIVLLFMVFLGRLTDAQAIISDAAHQAARAASIARDPATAAAQARLAAATALSGRGITCQHFAVTVDLAGFRPGGTVRATVTCTTGLSDLALLRVPGSQTMSASFTSVVDTYRGLAPGAAGSASGTGSGGGP